MQRAVLCVMADEAEREGWCAQRCGPYKITTLHTDGPATCRCALCCPICQMSTLHLS